MVHFRKYTNKALSKKEADNVIETIKKKYRSKKNKLGYVTLNNIVYKEYRKAGYKGNTYNDSLYIRDSVSYFLLKKSLGPRKSRSRSRKSRSRRRSRRRFGLSAGIIDNLLA